MLITKMLITKIENPILPNPLKSPDPGQAREIFGKAIAGTLAFFLTGATVTFLIYFLIGGMSWILSQGEEAKVKVARDKVTQSVIGLVVTFSIFALLKMIGYAFGISGLEDINLPLVPLI